MLKRSVSLFILAAFLCGPVPAIAESPEIECLKKQVEIFGRHAKESEEADRYVKSIKGKYDLLCRYGRTKGANLIRAQIAEQEGRKDTVCWSEINTDVLKQLRAAFDGYLKHVQEDCRQARAAKSKGAL